MSRQIGGLTIRTVQVGATAPELSLEPFDTHACLDRDEVEQLLEACQDFLDGRRL